MLDDKSANLTPADPWGDLMFLRDLRDRFGGDLDAHLVELTEEERARLQAIGDRMKQSTGWRRT
jgi:hypothetical protein